MAGVPSFPNDGTPELVSFLRAAVIPDPLVVTPHTSVSEAAALMARARSQPASDSLIPDQDSLHQQARSGCVVVLDPDRGVLGSFSACDLVALAATAPSLHALSMAEVMIQPVLHLTESDSIGLVERLRDLREGGRRYLPAVDEHGMLLGILNLDQGPLASPSPAQETHGARADRTEPAPEHRRVIDSHRMLVELGILQISGSIEIGDILQKTLQHCRDLLGCSRASIWKFEDGWRQTVVVAESTDESPSLLGERFEDVCFSENLVVEHYFAGYVRVVPDIHEAALSECHLQRLISLHTRAKVLVPLISGGLLWGLLKVSESDRARDWAPDEVEFLKDVAVQLGIALQQASTRALLEASEERLRLALKAADQGLFDLNIQTGVAIVSPEYALMMGYDPASFEETNQRWLERLHPEDLPTARQNYLDYLDGKLSTYQAEFRMRNHNGDWQWILSQGSIVEWDGEGQPLRMLGTHTEITQRKQAELALVRLNAELEDRVEERTLQLRSEELRLQDLFDSTNDLIQSVRLSDSHFEFVNQAWLRLLGYGAEELDALTLYDVIHPDDVPECHRLIQDMQAGCLIAIDQIELTFITKTKQEAIVEGSIHCSQEAGIVIAARGIFRDISERKRSEQLLLEREARYRGLLEGASDAILLADTDCRLLEVNRRAEELMGRSKEELLQMHVSQFHPSDEMARAAEVFKNMEEGQHYQLLDTRILNSSGRTIPVDITCTQLRVGNSVINQEIFRDISDRHQAELIVQQQATHETLLREVTQRIRQSLDLQTIFQTACEEIRLVLGADRVGVFRFDSQSGFNDGLFVAESVLADYPAAMSANVHDHCFGDNFSDFYTQGPIFVCSDIYQAQMSDCHRDILAQFHVRANLVIPLVPGGVLWGLLCIHQCSDAREWSADEIDLSQQLANQLAIATQQALLYQQVQAELAVREQAERRIAQQLREQEALGMISSHIRESLNIKDILDVVSVQSRSILDCERVIVFQLHPDGRSQIVSESVADDFPSLIGMGWENEVWDQEILDHYLKGEPRIVADVMNDRWTDCLVDFSVAGQISSKIVAPILSDGSSVEESRWLMPNRQRQLWGVLVAHACTPTRVWKQSCARMLQSIANQLTLAINQSGLFMQLQQELSERQMAQAQLSERNGELAVSNAELLRATRLKDQFLANMSHELRTPLNVILGMSEGLQDSVFGQVTDRQATAIGSVQSSATHLLELINDILDLSKSDAGRLDLSCAPTSVTALCQSSLAFIRQQASEKHIELFEKVQEQLPDLLIDERRMRQVLINLLNNAVKFTYPGGDVRLEVFILQAAESPSKQDTLRFSVVDTGIGISPEDQAQIFRPFVQIDSALNREYLGTGLGLVLAKRIVELHGGTVSMSSALGQGSSFHVDLPLQALATSFRMTTPGSPPATADAIHHPSRPAPLLLLAEDNEANIATVSGYLKAKGYRLIIARDGHQAVEMAQTDGLGLILMDVQMPVMDGLEAMRCIRSKPGSAHMPIIALTALAMDYDHDRCMAAGADRYVSKPVTLRQLVVVIEELLSAMASRS